MKLGGPDFKTFLHGSLISIIGAGALGVVNYFTRRILALELTEAEYGYFYSGLSLIMLLMAFLDLGLTQSGVILIARADGRRDEREASEIFSATLGLKVMLGSACLLLAYLLMPWLIKYYLKSECYLPFGLLLLLLVTESASGAFSALWQGLKKFTLLNSVNLSKVGLTLIFSIILVPRWQLAGAAVALLLPGLIIFAGNCVLARMVFRTSVWRPMTLSRIDELWQIGKFIAAGTMGFTSLYYIDIIMITALRGVDSSAMYNIALPIMQIIQAMMIFPMVFLPIATNMYMSGKIVELRRACDVALLIALAAAPLVWGGFYLAAPWLICHLFAAKYLAAAPAVAWLCAGMLFYTLANFNFQLLCAANRQKITAKIIGIGVGVNILLNCVLITWLDFTGAALTNLIVNFMLAVSSNLLIRKSLRDCSRPPGAMSKSTGDALE